MIAVRGVMAVLVTVPVSVIVGVMAMIVSKAMLVVGGGGILGPLSWRVFVLVAVLEVTVAVGMGVHGRHEASVPPSHANLSRFDDGWAGVRAPGRIPS